MSLSGDAFRTIGWRDVGFLLICFALIYFRCFSFRFLENEIDVIPSIYQFFNRAWLPDDWYLNLNVGYRNLFNAVFGRVIHLFGFEQGAYVSRILLYLFFSLAYWVFVKAIRLNLLYAALVLAVFLENQSIVADEWILGGTETKTLSYAFVLLAVSCFIRGKVNTGLIFSGLAFSFHVLIGLYAVFCIGVALLFVGNWRDNLIAVFKRAWIFLLFGFNGVLFCYSQFTEMGSLGSAEAWRDYVVFRVPHHALPGAWSGMRHFILMPILVLLPAYLIIFSQNSKVRFLAWHSVGCILLIIIGFMVYLFVDVSYMRYYFFRYPDVMLLLFSMVSAALFWQNAMNSPTQSESFPDILFHNRLKVGGAVNIMALISLISALAYYGYGFIRAEARPHHRQYDRDHVHFLQWIQSNTAKDDLFLIDPTYGAFYIEANRPVFVTFKHVPQLSGDIIEWVSRMKVLNNGSLPVPGGYKAKQALRSNYSNLSAAHIQSINVQYGVDYFLASGDSQYPFTKVYYNEEFALYRLSGD